MNDATAIRPSQQLINLIDEQAWTDTTVIDLLRDFLDAHPSENKALLSYSSARTEIESEDAEPEPAAPGQSVEDLDRSYGIQRAATGDLFDFEYARKQPVNHVWTITEGDDDSWWACPGFHIVNRLGYITTERPWVTGDELFRFDD